MTVRTLRILFAGLALCGTVVGGGAGFLLANLNEWDRAQTRRTALEDQKASVVGLNAWRKKRAELGIEDQHR